MFQGHRLLWLGGLLPTAALMLLCSGDVALSSFDGKGEPGIAVMLRFSVDELDPLKPGKSFVECVVRNGSDRAVEVPTVYTRDYEGDLILSAGARHGLWMIAWAEPAKQKKVLLLPGREITVFKDELRAVLLLDLNAQKPLLAGEKTYHWTWMA